MGDVDYGYGDDAAAYGYGDDAGADYGYGDDAGAADYGYGDDAGAADYGYGDAPASTDYGYGDQGGDDYGYGDQGDPYGYGDTVPDEAPAPLPPKTDKRPKRRCSVTRFSIEAEANNKPLDYNWTAEGQEQAQESAPAPESAADEKSQARTESTVDTNDGEESMLDKIPAHKLNMPKKGRMSKIRKRLSIM